MYSENDWRNYSELYHHGVLGQKWGVRRYQNSDGTLTEAGRKRYGSNNRYSKEQLDQYRSYYNKSGYSSNKERLRKNGIITNLEYDIVPKHKDIIRTSSVQNETLDTKRKYVTIGGLGDAMDYERNSVVGGTNNDRYSHLYSMKRDIKVANPDKMYDFYADYISKTFGNNLVKELKANGVTIDDIRAGGFIYDKNYPRNLKQLASDIEKSRNLIREASDSIVYKNVNTNVINQFKKSGYDAIIDMNDYLDFTNYPMIILNPLEVLNYELSEKL